MLSFVRQALLPPARQPLLVTSPFISRGWKKVGLAISSNSSSQPRQQQHLIIATQRQGRVLCQQRTTTSSTLPLRDPRPEMVDARHAPSDFVVSSTVVYRDFVTEEEATDLVNDLNACLRRRRYEKGHWDAVIVQYKETELLDETALLSLQSQNVLHKVRHQLKERHLIGRTFQWLPCHAIDLHKDGELNAHVDSVRFSGDIVSGLSLLSPSIMRLIPDSSSSSSSRNAYEKSDDDDISRGWVDLYLPPRSLYCLSGPARYQYSHQLLPSESVFVNDAHPDSPIAVVRDHRLSVIFRDSKDQEEEETATS